MQAELFSWFHSGCTNKGLSLHYTCKILNLVLVTHSSFPWLFHAFSLKYCNSSFQSTEKDPVSVNLVYRQLSTNRNQHRPRCTPTHTETHGTKTLVKTICAKSWQDTFLQPLHLWFGNVPKEMDPSFRSSPWRIGEHQQSEVGFV